MTPSPIESLVRDRIGLDPASLGAATLPRAVDDRMGARGLTSVDAYAGLLTTDPSEWAALLGDLVVPETWFFRGGRGFFDALARWVRERAAARPKGWPVRVLSIPCSTGEEPYSLAIALDAEGVSSAACRVDGVELSRDHLLRAVASQYPAFSFRESGPDPRQGCFREVEPGRWEVLSHIRERIRFRPGNIVDPDLLCDEAPYDLILCRNLFIYLTPEGRMRALANLDRLLAPDGRLCLTPTEADRLPSTRYVPDGPVALAAFRRAAPGGIDPGPRSGVIPLLRPTQPGCGATEPAPAPRSGVQAIPHRAGPSPKPGSGVTAALTSPRSAYVRVPLSASPPREASGPDARPTAFPHPPDPLQTGRALADAGRLEEARAVCEAATGGPSPTASLFALLGVIHLAAGRSDDAAEAFRKALYLDPNHADGLTHMIVLCEQRGDRGQAAGLRRRLGRLDREVPA
ncbi:MAG: chemotaxis protein CheW [Gemmataceae bacterium]|nr:chemotaxis protein CheW [Gemmataceae bacterium]